MARPELCQSLKSSLCMSMLLNRRKLVLTGGILVPDTGRRLSGSVCHVMLGICAQAGPETPSSKASDGLGFTV